MISPCLSINEKGHLVISGCDTVELAKSYGTPLYVMSEDEIRFLAEDISRFNEEIRKEAGK